MSSIYDEFRVITLNAFAEMLNIEQRLRQNSSKLEMVALEYKLYWSLVVLKKVVSKSVDGFTPLMLYVASKITDGRYQQELTKGSDTILEYRGFAGFNMSSSQRINALTFAVISRNIGAVRQLLETGLFVDSKNYEMATEIAAVYNIPEVFPVLIEYQLNLFTYDFLSRKTPLQFALGFDYIEVVKAILQANPKESDLELLDCDGQNAFSTVLQKNNPELKALFSHYTGLKRCELVLALQQKQLIKCQEIVSMAHPNEQILLIPQGTVYHSILAGVHETQDYEVLVDVMDAHLERMNKTDQAHTLIITLLELYRKDDVLTVFSQYLKQLEEIVKTNPEQINCIFIPFNLGKSDDLDDLATVFYNILEHSPLKEIRFNEHIPDFYDARSDAFYPINLVSSTAASFVNALLSNVFIEKCDIMLPSEYQSLVNIVRLICERNQLINKCKSEISKDAVFNRYVNRINEQISFFKQSDGISPRDKEPLNELELRTRLYSLQEIAGLSFFMKARNESMTNIEHKSDIPFDKQNVDIASLIGFDPQAIAEAIFSP